MKRAQFITAVIFLVSFCLVLPRCFVDTSPIINTLAIIGGILAGIGLILLWFLVFNFGNNTSNNNAK